MSYTFPLQKILDLKEKEKESMRLSLAESLGKKNDAEKEWQEISRRRQEVEEEFTRTPSQVVRMSDLVDQYRFLCQTARLEKEKVEQLKEIEREVEEKREEVKGKEMEVKTFQRLKDKELGRWKVEEARKEQGQLDEISQRAYLQKME